MTINKLLTPSDVSELLGVSIGTLEVWRSTNRYHLPYIKVGRSVRYKRDDVREFIESRRRLQTSSK